MTAKTAHLTPERGPVSQLLPFLTVLAGFVWTWAVALVATRHHLVGNYGVVQGAPWLWGAIVLPVPLLLLIGVLGVLITSLCVGYCRAKEEPFPLAIRWLLVASIVPFLDLLRLLGISIPLTFVEPLLLAGVTAYAVGEMAVVASVPARVRERVGSVPWLLIVWVVAILLGFWWYSQSVHAYDNFLLGFNDFGHFGQRVANTWAGRGFLMETPSLPSFWDHFNPGLALLAPVWGFWPDPRLFMLLQAICLVVSAPIVYSIARQLGATTLEAAMWGIAFLVYPALSQLNLSYSYGWHPVSLALPLLFLTLLLLLRGQRMASFAVALLACSFREDVVVILGCLAGAMFLQRGWARWRGEEVAMSETGILADRLPLWGWGAINLVFVVAFVLIYTFSGLREFQVSRFARLGDTVLEVVASPLFRPGAFWGTVLRTESAYYLLALLIPLGARSLRRGKWILLACALPVGVLIAWGHGPATSIAFQYTTTLIPILFLSAMVGSREGSGDADSKDATGAMWRGTVTGLVGCAVASLWLGASPWCGKTLTDVLGQTYATGGFDKLKDRLPGSEGIEALHDAVALVEDSDASVLATGRIAAHFVGAGMLDTVGQARLRWDAFEAEAGPGRSGIELFEWIVVDTYEHFQQSEEDTRFVLDQAERSGYRGVSLRQGVMVLRRQEAAGSPANTRYRSN